MSDTAYVKAKLESAGKTLALFPRGWGKPQGHRSGWPDTLKEMIVFVQEDGKGLEVIMPEMEVIRRKASVREATELDVVIGWLQDYAAYCWRRKLRSACAALMWDAMLHHPEGGHRLLSWRKIGDRYGISHETARRWYEDGIARIASMQGEKSNKQNIF